MPPQRDAVRARPGARLPPILQGRPDPRMRRNMEAYAERHDVRGLMAELTQSIMVGMPEDPRRFLAAEMGRQLQQQTDDRNDLGAMPRDSFVLRLHASTGHGREGAGGRVLRWQGVLSSAPSGRMARYQAERELTEQLRAVIWGGGAGGGEHHLLHAEPQLSVAEPSQVEVLGDTPVEAAVLEMDPTKSDEAAWDFKMRLGMCIAAGPDAFFALADTKQEDILSPQGWLEACKSSLGNVDETLCRSIFDQMDLDKDGKVSREEFIAMRNAICLFVKNAKCQEMFIEVLAGLVAAHWQVGGDDDTSVAHKTTEVLTELSVDELRKELAAVLPRRMKDHGDEVKREREERKKKLAAFQVEEGEGKFAQLPTAAYGTKDDFHKGLEVLGQPHPHTLEELIRECQKCKDSLDDFEAWNSGKNITNSSKELDFVVEPFETPQGWQDQDPKDWKPKHEYGGKRIPIRLQVFMHVLSVLESGVRFGDYKGAHKLDKNDPLWLHAKEVDMLKVVLCRFIKSQLTGQALIDALDNAKDVDKPAPLSLSKADVRAAKIIKALSKGLSEGGDGSASTCTFGFVLQTVLDEAAATEWELEVLLDHFHALFASKPVGKAEVIAGRAYTGPLYFKMNGSLRKASKKFGEQAHLKGNSYTNLVYSANSLLRKFSQICIIPPGRKVYRGMSGYRLPDCFLVCLGGGGRGGVDFAFLSTSTKLEVAVSYIGDKAMPILFEFDVGDIDRGASLSFLSQYPIEDEVLIPPLSYLEVTGEPFFMNTDKGEVTVYPARINCNLKSKTIEEIREHRQKEILDMLPYLKGALQRDMPVFVEALAADFKEKAEETQLKKLDALQAQISRDFDAFDALSTDLATPGKMSWLNQDSNYKQSICEVIDFKHVRMSKLVRELSALEEGYLKDPLTTNLHVAAREGRTKTVAALLSFGADADAKDKAGRRALELAKDDATFEALKAGGATMSDMTQQKKNDLLIEYVKKGLAGGALMALQAGADVNHQGGEGNSCLHIAAAQGSNAILRILLNAGAKVSAKNKAGNTAVERAQNAQTIDLLKGAGATMPEFPEEKKNDLLIEYAEKGLAGGLLMALQAGAGVNHKDWAGNTAVVWAQNAQTIDLLKGAGATMPEFPEEKKNDLLIEYAKKGATGGALMALQAGAGVNAVNHKESLSRTALHIAAEGGHEALAQVLLGAGANINAEDAFGWTPLHFTAVFNKPEVAKVLLANGAQVNVRCKYGHTALARARDNDSREMEALLRQHGAESAARDTAGSGNNGRGTGGQKCGIDNCVA